MYSEKINNELNLKLFSYIYIKNYLMAEYMDYR